MKKERGGECWWKTLAHILFGCKNGQDAVIKEGGQFAANGRKGKQLLLTLCDRRRQKLKKEAGFFWFYFEGKKLWQRTALLPRKSRRIYWWRGKTHQRKSF